MLLLDDIVVCVGVLKILVWNWICKLCEVGVIWGQVVLLDFDVLGLDVCFFVLICISEYDFDWVKCFLVVVCVCFEVIEVYRLVGDIDYILKVWVWNVCVYDWFYQVLILEVKIYNVIVFLFMEELKVIIVLLLS